MADFPVPQDRPPRPKLSDSSPSPLSSERPEVRGLGVARVLAAGSALVGFAFLAFAYLARESRIAALRDLVEQMRPGDDEAIERIAATAYTSALIALAVIFVIEVLAGLSAFRSRRLAPGAAVSILLLHVVVAVFAGSVVAAEGRYGRLVVLALAVQFTLALATAVVFAIGARRAERAQQSHGT